MLCLFQMMKIEKLIAIIPGNFLKFLISCPSVSTRAHNYVIAVIKTMTTSKKLTSYSDWDLGWEIKRSEKRGHRVESN